MLEVELEQGFEEGLEPLEPGRFAMLTPEQDVELTVPRPFSVYEQLGPRRLSFLIQVLGAGTRVLGELEPGAALRCTLPLGNGFRLAPPEREVVLVAGGVGSAPFLLYAQARAGAAAATHLLYGARSADRLYDRGSFAIEGVRRLDATDDGSLGFHGNVVACLDAELAAGRVSEAALYCACGPEPLLHAFAAFARERGLEAQLSLETYMGCGIGVCNGCPIDTAPDGAYGDWPYAKSCLDGPVFALADLAF